METECPSLHMLCTNTSRKVMAQLPLTTNDVNNIEAIKCTYFLQISAYDVLKNACCKADVEVQYML